MKFLTFIIASAGLALAIFTHLTATQQILVLKARVRCEKVQAENLAWWDKEHPPSDDPRGYCQYLQDNGFLLHDYGS